MSKHSKDDQPRTGNGKTSGKKPAKYEVAVQTSGGAWLWKQIAALRKGMKS